MKEELISFKTAVLAKEEGFSFRSEPYRYNKEGELTLLEGINVPTQSLLQRWLREVHDIDIFITEGFHNISKYKVYTNPSWGYFEEYSTYEEALEKGLYEALLIIKEKQ